MNLVSLGAWTAIIAFSVVSLFQIALIAGAPWGEYAFGGQHKGKLPTSFRVGSAFTLLLYVGIVGHYLAQVGVFTKFLDAGLNGIANWALPGASVGIPNQSPIYGRATAFRRFWAHADGGDDIGDIAWAINRIGDQLGAGHGVHTRDVSELGHLAGERARRLRDAGIQPRQIGIRLADRRTVQPGQGLDRRVFSGDQSATEPLGGIVQPGLVARRLGYSSGSLVHPA